MLRRLRLTAALVAGLAVPAFAQTTSTSPTPVARPVPPTVQPVTPVRPAVPTPTPAPAATVAPTPVTNLAMTGRKIDLNSASAQELDSLRGIGPATAKNIILGRPWDDMADLVKKKAMPQNVFDQNKERFALANINTSSVSDMSKTLPGIGDARARKIAESRPYAKPDDLVSKSVLTQALYDKIKDVITY